MRMSGIRPTKSRQCSGRLQVHNVICRAYTFYVVKRHQSLYRAQEDERNNKCVRPPGVDMAPGDPCRPERTQSASARTRYRRAEGSGEHQNSAHLTLTWAPACPTARSRTSIVTLVDKRQGLGANVQRWSAMNLGDHPEGGADTGTHTSPPAMRRDTSWAAAAPTRSARRWQRQHRLTRGRPAARRDRRRRSGHRHADHHKYRAAARDLQLQPDRPPTISALI